jgi:metal-responsive CopG/Arc/MetJ family transcriptional regulator
MNARKKMKRGAAPRAECVFVGAWVPINLADALDRAVFETDSDRSKIIREALREKITATAEAA